MIEKGNYTEKDAANLIHQILSGVAYLHSHGAAPAAAAAPRAASASPRARGPLGPLALCPGRAAAAARPAAGQHLPRGASPAALRPAPAHPACSPSLCAGIVHRDLKLENMVMLNDRDDSPVKIADFGLSKFFSAETVRESEHASALLLLPRCWLQLGWPRSRWPQLAEAAAEALAAAGLAALALAAAGG